MYELQDWAAVQRVYKQTGSKRRTAEILGMARNTVKRLLKMTEAPAYHRNPGVTLIDPFRQQIIEWRCAPFDFNGTRIDDSWDIRTEFLNYPDKVLVTPGQDS